MEQLFAVRVLVHYYDKPKVDHAAVRRLLSAAAVDALPLLLSDGTSISISVYINTAPLQRIPISDVLGPSSTALVQVAAVFMLAEARAAADALCSTPADLDTACSALERLLACLTTTRPLLPLHDINQSARVKLGTAARRRALSRAVASPSSQINQPAILTAVNFVLRLCDVATHCLAVVSRQAIAPPHTCQTAVHLSTRLLTLAASLYDVQRLDRKPALSFFSSNSLRTALVSGAMYLGAITIEHLHIEPMNWVHVANRIVISSTTSVPPRTSIMSALFAGMIKSAKDYEASERDTMAARRAASLLSTLHAVLETDLSRDLRERQRHIESSPKPSDSSPPATSLDSPDSLSMGSAPITQAARSFLGERVVAAEEDGDEARIAARTVYQACEEYAERAGETDGVMGLLARLFSSAGRQCRMESADDPIVSISEGALNLPCPPDESDASSDSPQMRSETQQFPIDVFDQRSRDGFATSPTPATAPDDALESAERLELHREIGALALETLAHWVERTLLIQRYADLDIARFGRKICASAGMFSLNESPASYDMRAAMIDFGFLIGVAIDNRLSELPTESRAAKWDELLVDLISSCQRINPILTGIIGCCRSSQVVSSLLHSFLAKHKDTHSDLGRSPTDPQGLPVGSALSMLFDAITPENALMAVESLVQFLKERETTNLLSATALSHRAACFMLLGHAALVHIGVDEMKDTIRSGLASLYTSDVDSHQTPIYPQKGLLTETRLYFPINCSVSAESIRALAVALEEVPPLISGVCRESSRSFNLSSSEHSSDDHGTGHKRSLDIPKSRKLLYHFLWSVLMVQRVFDIVEGNSRYRFQRIKVDPLEPCDFPTASPFVCLESLESSGARAQTLQALKDRKSPSFRLLYVAECLSLLLMYGKPRKDPLCILLKSLVSNVMDITSELVMRDGARNFATLLDAFRDNPSSLFFIDEGSNLEGGRSWFLNKEAPCGSIGCVQLAMNYIRVLGGDEVRSLLSDALSTATRLLDFLPPESIAKEKTVIFAALQVLVFLPESFSDLSRTALYFAKKVLTLSFDGFSKKPVEIHSLLLFIARVCGFSTLVSSDEKSLSGIQALCKFANDTSTGSELDRDALDFALGYRDVPQKFGIVVSRWLSASLPRVVLPNMLAPLLVPADESAVAVSSHAQSLALLTAACELSESWRSCVLSGIGEVMLATPGDFSIQMVRRSVMQSATMNDGIISLFERIVGVMTSIEAANILLKCFDAAQFLFEKESDASLETRIRLLNFCVRVCTSYGRVSLKSETGLFPDCLEPRLFSLLYHSLELSSRNLQSNPHDSSQRQVVLFLCGLLDCIHSGLYENYASYFSSVGSPGLGEAPAVLSSKDRGDIEVDLVQEQESGDHHSGQIAEDQVALSLCTYTSTGNQYVEQHWYYCYSCCLDGSEGVCSVCARVCHKGCELTYSKFSRFFCDCGASSDPRLETNVNPLPSSDERDVPNDNQETTSQKLRPARPKEPKPCLCMKTTRRADPKPTSKTSTFGGKRSATPSLQQERDSLLSSSLRRILIQELSSLRVIGAPTTFVERYNKVENAFRDITKDRQSAECLVRTALCLIRDSETNDCEKTHPIEWTTVGVDLSKECAPTRDPFSVCVVMNNRKLRSTRLLKSSSMVHTVASNFGNLKLPSASLISFSPFQRTVAISTRSGEIELFDLSSVLGSNDLPQEKTLSLSLGKIPIHFTVRHLAFHPNSSNMLLVLGDSDVSVGTRVSSNRGEQAWVFSIVEARQAELNLFGCTTTIVDSFWVEGETTLLAVVTQRHMLVFDVAVDSCIPCIHVALPTDSQPLDDKPDEGQCILGATVWRDLLDKSEGIFYFVLFATSKGRLLVSRLSKHMSSTPTCEPFFQTHCDLVDDKNVDMSSVSFHRQTSSVVMSFVNGTIISVSFVVRKNGSSLEYAIRWVNIYKEVVHPGHALKLIWVPGPSAKFIFFQTNQGLTSCGVGTIHPNCDLDVHFLTGNPSCSVLGASSYPETSAFGNHVPSGAVLLLDDGSIHKLDVNVVRAKFKQSEQSCISSVVERQRLRSLKLSQGSSEAQISYSPIPEAIGFFEKCRIVSEQVTIDGPRLEAGLSYERMAVILAGEGADCVVSQVVNAPFSFSASINNQSLILVGARLRFGGTERSRNRVPAEVKVFDRVVKWHGRNGQKRWIDIPLSVAESTNSPQKVTIDLVPHASSDQGKSGADGLVAVDCLELHAVSTIEFTERKLLFEKEKSMFTENLKKRKELSRKERKPRYPGFDSSSLSSGNLSLQDQRFNHEQASVLTVIHCMDDEVFSQLNSICHLLHEVNCLWSGSLDGHGVWDPRFLEFLLKSSLGLESQGVLSDDGLTSQISIRVGMLYKGARRMTQTSIHESLYNGLHPLLSDIEKAIFSVGGLARSLLAVGRKREMSTESWIITCRTHMPPVETAMSLLSLHVSVGRSGRLWYRSLEHVCIGAVDIALLYCMFNSVTNKTLLDHDKEPFVILVKILCDVDQRLRLLSAQRVIEVFDSVDGITEYIGSPFESYMTAILLQSCDSSEYVSVPSESPDLETVGEGEESDETQRWAYRCDSCGEVCDQEWWHCINCEDFDLCTDCLRSGKQCEGSPHCEDHALLRGTLEDEIQEPSNGEGSPKITPLSFSLQDSLCHILDSIIQGLCNHSRHEWHFLDSIEVVAQLVGPKSIPEFREPRLDALFKSSFLTVLNDNILKMQEELDSNALSRLSSPSLIHICETLCLLMKVLLSGRGSSMPVHIHSHNLPRLLFNVLERLRDSMQIVTKDVSSDRNVSRPPLSDEGFLSGSVWNDNIPGLVYDVLAAGIDSKPMKSRYKVFEHAEDLCLEYVAVLNVVADVLRVLEFAYRSVWSTAIRKEVRNLPQGVMCDIINMCENAGLQSEDPSLFNSVSTAAKGLLSVASLDNDDTLNGILDRYLYDDQCNRLYGILQSVSSGSHVISYEISVQLAGIINNLQKAAILHPATWRDFVIGSSKIINSLFVCLKLFEGNVQVQILQLIGSGLCVSQNFSSRVLRGHAFLDYEHSSSKSDELSNSRSDVISDTTISKKTASCADLASACREEVQVSQDAFSHHNFEMLEYLVKHVMLKSLRKKGRRAASQIFVFAVARSCKEDDNQSLLKAVDRLLSKGLDWMQFAGDLGDGLMVCMRFYISCCQQSLFGPSSDSLLTSLTSKITALLKDRCRLLVSHPNARLYGRLAECLDLPGYYLESEPCITCATSTWESSEFRDCRLDTIRAETKYTDCSIMYRLMAIHEIQVVSVKIVDPRRSRRVKTIDVFYSARSIADGADLKSSEHPWKRLKSISLEPNSTDGSISLTIPVTIANIRLDFVEFHSSESKDSSSHSLDDNNTSDSTNTNTGGSRRANSSRSNDSLQCPRCSRTVTDRHGICRNCHENAYQCRQCRNINYENLDGFLCNECGYCKHGRFEFTVIGRPTHFVETIKNEEDRKRASKIIEKETSNVHRCMEQLIKLRSSIIKALTSGMPTDDFREKSKILSTTRVGLADLLDSVTPRSEIAVLEALLEGQVSQELDDTSSSLHGGVNISDEVLGDGQVSVETSERDQPHRTGSSIASPVGRVGRTENASKSQSIEANNVNRRTNALSAMYSKECRTIFATMSRGIRVLTMTRAELVRYANSVGGDRLRYADEFSRKSEDSEVIAEHSVPELNHILGKLKGSGGGTVCCYGCTQAFISKCVRLVQTISKRDSPASSIIRASDLSKDMLIVCSLCEKKYVREDIRDLITYLVNDSAHATQLVCKELGRKIGFCIESYETVDSHSVTRFEMRILEAIASLDDNCWEERLRLVIRILFQASSDALTCSAVAESIILPCLRIALRLLRSDSELTVIESSSEVGNALDTIISESLPEQSDPDNDDAQTTGDAGSLTHSDTMVQDVLRTRTSEGIASSALGDIQAMAPGSLGSSHGLIGFRESTRMDDRRSTHRVGSDLMSGSRAPSSVGTAFDGHMSDEEIDTASDRTEQLVSMGTVNSVLESDHDAKRVSANIGLWLDGRHSQASWMAELTERSKTHEDREKPVPSSDVSSISLQKSIFHHWKRMSSKTTQRYNQQDARQTPESHLNKLSIKKGNWIVRLMLFTPCAAVRKEACSLLELLCGQEEILQLQLLDMLTGPSLSLGADVGDMSKEFFDLLESTLTAKSHRLYLVGRGFLPRLACIIRYKAERLIRCEAEVESSVRLVNFTEGYSLKRLVSLLRLTLEVVPSKRLSVRQKLLDGNSNNVVWSLQRAYVCVKKLISLRTRLTDECASQLSTVLLSKDFLFSGPTVESIVSACVSELQSANLRNDAQAVAILLEELCLMLCPERSEPTCLLSLNKAPTQEEYIRGSMSRNPYPSSSFDGPLMRHVKNKICKDLDLPGLLQDDFTMELLVAGNVVKLDLPIMGVYEHVWRGSSSANMAAAIPPAHVSRTFGLRRTTHAGGSRSNGGSSRGDGLRGTILSFRRVNSERDNSDTGARAEPRTDPPMVVVYRLSGLDGEATEPIIDSLPSQTNDDQDAEDLYGDTIMFGEVGGFDVLFQLLAVVGSWGDDAETAVRAPALRLLRCSCEVAQNRTLLAKSPNAVSTLLDCAASAFEHAQGSPAAVSSAESLLIAAEQILAQQRRELDRQSQSIQGTVQVSSDDPEEVLSRVQMFLRQLEVATSPKAEYSILHLLPFLIQGIQSAISVVQEQFLFDWDDLETMPNEQRKAKQLGTVLFATPRDLRGSAFVAEAIRAGVATKAVKYIIDKFPMPKRDHREKWEASLEEDSLPLVLRLLTGLCQFFCAGASEACGLLRDIIRQTGIVIPVLCQLELAVSGNAIGSSAEEAVEAMARDEVLSALIVSERESIVRIRREAARASRAAILKESGLSVSTSSVGVVNPGKATGDESVAASNSFLEMMEDLPEEEGPACVVCGDGFQCRPEEALAVYVYCRKTPLELNSKWSNGQHGNGDGGSSNSGGSSTQGGARLDWDLWPSGRSRGGIGGSSRSGTSSCYTTVTHMNAIHLSCHKDAARMDRSSRRDEWDGAALRNSQTKCNNLLPIRPPLTLRKLSEKEDSSAKAANSSYMAAVEAYFGRLSTLGRVSLPQAKTVVYDLGRGLLRFANGTSGVFSEHSKGGGAHSNATLIPHMVQMGLYVIDERGDGGDVGNGRENFETLKAGLNKLLSEDEVGDVTYYMALAVLLYDLKEWSGAVCKLMRRGLRDGIVARAQVIRLVTFADVVNRWLKKGVVVEEGQMWADALRRHIGCDETFAQRFGDEVNERWERYIRSVQSESEMTAALRLNFEVDTIGDDDEKMVAGVSQVLSG